MYDKAYIEYLVHFHGTRDYFECHEILEDRWKEELPLDRESIWVAFIQLAVSLYHHRRGNINGALRLIKKAKQKFIKHEKIIEQYGLDKQKLLLILDQTEEDIMNGNPYKSVFLPIKDEKLMTAVEAKCKELGCSFSTKSDLNNPQLIHRHKLRHK
ncbi:DUF309 domain-containing protein [Salirhabdus salicampi]|uniref:DUF309 domain-containing protein n=1 Tax=Salirhabdus salicampi TaxID=476102 RepID=UPI0020C42173|nr:DUF309 domain-containing protein [Salirhabdus salicampi]MCP8616749.1 DUF309 domain-containing protein [Salirhabdus salicampi]